MAGYGISWLRQVFDVGFCVTFARRMAERDLLTRLGVPARQIRRLNPDEFAALELSDTWVGPMIRAGTEGEWTWAIETGGSCEGIRPVAPGRAGPPGRQKRWRWGST